MNVDGDDAQEEEEHNNDDQEEEEQNNDYGLFRGTSVKIFNNTFTTPSFGIVAIVYYYIILFIYYSDR